MDVDENEVTDMDYESSQSDFPSKNEQDEDEHWFCFDDSSVSCVTRQHIQKHYGQSECAYMLFYRNKTRKISLMDCGDRRFYVLQSKEFFF